LLLLLLVVAFLSLATKEEVVAVALKMYDKKSPRKAGASNDLV
jgi:hypothetical protein